MKSRETERDERKRGGAREKPKAERKPEMPAREEKSFEGGTLEAEEKELEKPADKRQGKPGEILEGTG